MLQQVGSSLFMQTVMSQQLECTHRSLLDFFQLSQGFCLDRVALIRSGLPKQRQLLACNQPTSTSFSSGLGKDKDNAHSPIYFWFQQGYFFGCLFGGPTYNRLWLKALHYLYCRSSINTASRSWSEASLFLQEVLFTMYLIVTRSYCGFNLCNSFPLTAVAVCLWLYSSSCCLPPVEVWFCVPLPLEVCLSDSVFLIQLRSVSLILYSLFSWGLSLWFCIPLPVEVRLSDSVFLFQLRSVSLILYSSSSWGLSLWFCIPLSVEICLSDSIFLFQLKSVSHPPDSVFLFQAEVCLSSCWLGTPPVALPSSHLSFNLLWGSFGLWASVHLKVCFTRLAGGFLGFRSNESILSPHLLPTPSVACWSVSLLTSSLRMLSVHRISASVFCRHQLGIVVWGQQ